MDNRRQLINNLSNFFLIDHVECLMAAKDWNFKKSTDLITDDTSLNNYRQLINDLSNFFLIDYVERSVA